MSEKQSKSRKPEKALRFFRDINALGALAIGGFALVIPGTQPVLATWAGINAAQAGGFELLRQRAAKKQSSQ